MHKQQRKGEYDHQVQDVFLVADVVHIHGHQMKRFVMREVEELFQRWSFVDGSVDPVVQCIGGHKVKNYVLQFRGQMTGKNIVA
jgi:hypothetical protein